MVYETRNTNVEFDSAYSQKWLLDPILSIFHNMPIAPLRPFPAESIVRRTKEEDHKSGSGMKKVRGVLSSLM